MQLVQNTANEPENETKPRIFIGATAFYNDDHGPETFQHLDLFDEDDLDIRLMFNSEEDVDKFFRWLASTFDTQVGVDLIKETREINSEVYHP